MSAEMKEHVRSCPTCQRVKANKAQPYGKYVGWQPPYRRWWSISIDYITGLPTTDAGNDALCVIMDSTSKRVHIVPCCMTGLTAAKAAEMVFDVVIRNHGLPGRIVSDRDPRFIANQYRMLFERMGTKLRFSPSYHPIYNSENERSHGVINDAFRSYVEDIKNWEKDLPMVEFVFSSHENIDTGKSPFPTNQLM